MYLVPLPVFEWINGLCLILQDSQPKIEPDLRADVDSVSRISAVPMILDVVCRTTGMGFAAVARVTEKRWIACSVLDHISFGLKTGGELKIETTICHEIRQEREPVIIDNVSEDERFRRHQTPLLYGFQSYISVPIILEDGSFFGTLCAINPGPTRVNTPEIVGTFQLFAQLIAKDLDADRRLSASQFALAEEREIAELREQFIAVLGHDLRTPMHSINALTDLLLGKMPGDESALELAVLMRASTSRMVGLINDLLDLARGRLGGGLPLQRSYDPLEPVLRQVVAELTASYPGRSIETIFTLTDPIDCDKPRVAQLLANILGNALTYGRKDQPIRIWAATDAKSLELTVANAGDPIPPEALARLFNPFYRSAGMQNRGGLGLGLYIAQQIATAHAGKITVDSTQQETRFTFQMPLA